MLPLCPDKWLVKRAIVSQVSSVDHGPLVVYICMLVMKVSLLFILTALDYVFACFCGIYSTSTVYFVIYIIFMKNKPKVYPKVILPGVISGLMWGGATAGWFVANQVLSPAIAFPIITTGPSIVASLWGIFIFHEIRVCVHIDYIYMYKLLIIWLSLNLFKLDLEYLCSYWS